MKYIKFTMVDRVTKRSISKHPAKNGRVLPEVDGLELKFANESQWPVSSPGFPLYYGTCNDNADLSISGILEELTEREYNEEYEKEFNNRKNQVKSLIDKERDRRIALGMWYDFPDGIPGTVQIRHLKDENIITGLGTKGIKLKIDNDTTTKIPFRDLENNTHSMNADELMDLGEAFMTYQTLHYSSGWGLKDMLNSVTTMEELESLKSDINKDENWPERPETQE